jgi:hypothetical protein
MRVDLGGGRIMKKERELFDPEYGSIRFIRNIGSFTSLHGLTFKNRASYI